MKRIGLVACFIFGQAYAQPKPYSGRRGSRVLLGIRTAVRRVRGSTGYGKTWLHADDGPKRLDVINDIEDCAKYIRTEKHLLGR